MVGHRCTRDVADTIDIKGNNGVSRMLKLSVSILSISFVMVMFWSTGSIDNNGGGGHFTTTMDRELSELPRVVGFWHIGNSRTSHESRDHFVMKQAKELLETYLFSEGLKEGMYDLTLNYVTQVNLSNETKAFLKETGVIIEHPPKVIELEEGVEYYEFPTLAELHSFCLEPENLESIVFYIHSKTSDRDREDFQHQLLGHGCFGCLNNERDKMACGANYVRGWRWSHFSGNFWMTRCSHVSKLNPPFFPEVLEEKNTPHSWPPYGRYMAEYWMMNDAGERPDHSDDNAPDLIPLSQVCRQSSSQWW